VGPSADFGIRTQARSVLRANLGEGRVESWIGLGIVIVMCAKLAALKPFPRGSKTDLLVWRVGGAEQRVVWPGWQQREGSR
jgi:hypothetical protein